MAKVNAVLFDADGVFQFAPENLPLRLADAMGLGASHAEELMHDLFRAEDQALTGAADFFTCTRSVLSKWQASCTDDDLANLWHLIDVDRTVLSVVADLRDKGVFCAVASNQQSYRARRMSVDLRYAELFDAEYYSCEVRHAKPSEAYFETVIGLAGLEAGATLFIDDRAANVEAARRIGLHAEIFVPHKAHDNGETMRGLLALHGL
jgi:putative hydrolase of the HAD superfamily